MSSNNSFISWKHDASHDESISLHAQNGGKFGINLLLKLLKVTNIGKVKNALGSEVRLRFRGSSNDVGLSVLHSFSKKGSGGPHHHRGAGHTNRDCSDRF